MSKTKERVFRICNIVLYVFLGLGAGGIVFIVINTLSDIEYGPNWLLCVIISILFAGALVVLCAVNLIIRLALTTENGLDEEEKTENSLVVFDAAFPVTNDTATAAITGEGNEQPVSPDCPENCSKPSVNTKVGRGKKIRAEVKYEIINIIKMIAVIIVILAVLAVGITFYFPHQNLSGTTSFIYMAVCIPVSLISVIAFFAVRYEILKTIPAEERIKKQVPPGDRIISYVGLVFLCLALALFCAFTCQNSLLFYPNSSLEAEQILELDDNYSRITVQGGNAEYSGWVYAPHGEDAPTLLIFYGNYQNAARVMAETEVTHYASYNTICIDYPGYGNNDGTPNEQSVYRMALASYDAIAGIPGLNPDKIIVLGHSIGTGFASYVAANRDVSGLVLLSPYSSGTDLCNSYLNIFHGPLSLLVANKLPSDEYAAAVKVDPLIIASESDKTVKSGLSEKLYNTYSRGEFVLIEEEKEISHSGLFVCDEVKEKLIEYIGRIK